MTYESKILKMIKYDKNINETIGFGISKYFKIVWQNDNIKDINNILEHLFDRGYDIHKFNYGMMMFLMEITRKNKNISDKNLEKLMCVDQTIRLDVNGNNQCHYISILCKNAKIFENLKNKKMLIKKNNDDIDVLSILINMKKINYVTFIELIKKNKLLGKLDKINLLTNILNDWM